MGTGDFGTSPIFASLSDKQLLVSIFLAGRRNARHNGESVPGIVLTASMPKSYSGAHCARSTAATGGAIDRLGVGGEKIV
jgi:hypothetical protein